MTILCKLTKTILLLLFYHLLIVGCIAAENEVDNELRAQITQLPVEAVIDAATTATPIGVLTLSSTDVPAPTMLPTLAPIPSATTIQQELSLEEKETLIGLVVCTGLDSFLIVSQSGELEEIASPHQEAQATLELDGVEAARAYGRIGDYFLVKTAVAGQQEAGFQSLGGVTAIKTDGSEQELIAESIIGRPILSADAQLAIVPTEDKVVLLDAFLNGTAPFSSFFYFGAISPDNRYVAHNGGQVGISDMVTGELVAEFAYEGALTVGDIPPQPFQWSSDSKWIALETFNLLAEPPDVPNQLLVLNTETMNAQTIPDASIPRWSPDNKFLLFANHKMQIKMLHVSLDNSWEVVGLEYSGLPVGWLGDNTLFVNDMMPLPTACRN